MKMEFTRKEVRALKDYMKKATNIGAIVNKEIYGVEMELEDYSLVELFKGVESDIMKMKLGLKGLTIEINDEYFVDVIRVYGKLMDASVPPIIAIFQAGKMMAQDLEDLNDKWSNHLHIVK